MRTRSAVRAAGIAVAVAALTTGCLSSGGGGGGSKNTSSSIEIMYGFTGNQSDDFQAVIKDWASKNGVTLKLSPSSDFNSLINTRVQANQLPDIAIFPQPGIMRTIAATGKLSDLSKTLNMSDLQSAYLPGALKAGQDDKGTQYAVLMSANVKSIVYYPKQAAQKAGLTQPPASYAQLQQLTNAIAGTGTTPWCFGIENGSATGWPATDWVETLMLDDYGSSVYNQWVQHKIPFNDPKVLAVLQQIQTLVLDHVNGGQKSVASNNFGTAGNPMFDNPPGCYMYRQGNFLTQKGFFPDNVVANLDSMVGVFPMPGTDPSAKPVEGGGDLAGLFSANNDAAKKTMEYLVSKDFQNAMAKKSWYLAPRKDVDLANYPSDMSRNFATIQNQSTDWVFDGSDQMPGAVGSGSFWKEMTSWIAGQEDAKTALDNIEKSWPTS